MALRIDAIQLELGTALRQRANLKRTAVDLAAAIAIFARWYLPLASGETRGGGGVNRPTPRS